MNRLVERFNGLMAVILIIAGVLALSQPVTFLGDPDWAQPVAMVGLLIGSWLILNKLRGLVGAWQSQAYRWSLMFLVGLILAAQVFVALNFVDIGRADSYFIRNQAIALAQGSTTWSHYMQVFTNNVNMTLVDALVLKWLLPITKTPWIFLNLVRYLWLDTGLVAGLYLIKQARRWQPGAFWFLLVWLLSVPVYALGLFDYTDVPVFPLFLNTLALVLWTIQRRGWVRWLGGALTLGMVSAGVVLKNNMLILWLATGVLILLLWWQKRLTGRQVFRWVGGAVLILATVMVGMNLWRHQAGYQRNPDTSMPVASWFAMGANPENPGTYSLTDTMLVNREPTAATKNAKSYKLLHQRLQRMGVGGTLVHLAQKFQIFWTTGDFDSFKYTTQWQTAPQWYRNNQRAIQFWLVLGTQLLYLTLLAQSSWVLWKSRHTAVGVSFLAVAMFGLMCFHVFFWEVEPRYAAPVLPALMLLGSLGWCDIPEWRWTRVQKRRGRWLGSLLVVVCALSLGETSVTTQVKQTMPGRQENGDYFTLPVRVLKPRQRMTWSMPVYAAANGIQLQLQPQNEAQSLVKMGVQPTYPNGELTIELRIHGKLYHTWRETPSAAMANPLTYRRTTARNVTLTVINTGKTTVKYGQSVARYDQHTGEILPRPRAYPRAYILDTHAAQMLTSETTILILMALFWLALMWAV